MAFADSSTYNLCKVAAKKHKNLCCKELESNVCCINCLIIRFLQTSINQIDFPKEKLTDKIVKHIECIFEICIRRGLDPVFMQNNCMSLLFQNDNTDYFDC